jgi:transcriptional regulator with XRE-family HTH domain
MGASTLGVFVSQRRKELGLRQQDLADALGYMVQAISRFENGQFQLDLATLPSLAKTLHLSLDDLLNEKDVEEDAPCQIDYNPRILQGNMTYLRRKADLTQKQVAKIASVSARSIANYEKGISQPPLDCVLSYLSHFEVRADDLFGIYLAPEAAATGTKKKRPVLLIPLVLFVVLVSGGGGYGIYVAFKNAKAPINSSSSATSSTSEESSSNSMEGSSSINDSHSSTSEQSFSSLLPEGPLYVEGTPTSLQRGRCYYLKQKETDLSYPYKFSGLRYTEDGTIIQGSSEMSTLTGQWQGFYVPFSPSLCAKNLAFFISDYSTSLPTSAVYSLPVEDTSGVGFGGTMLRSLINNYTTNRETAANGLTGLQQKWDEATTEGKNQGYLDSDGNETASCPASFKTEWEADGRSLQAAKEKIASWTFLIKLVEDDSAYLGTLS